MAYTVACADHGVVEEELHPHGGLVPRIMGMGQKGYRCHHHPFGLSYGETKIKRASQSVAATDEQAEYVYV